MTKFNLPDFDDMIKLVNEIYDLSKEKARLEMEIKLGEKEAIEYGNDTIRIDGKRPSMAYLESTIKFSGINDSLIEPRKKLSEISNKIDYNKALLEIYRLKIDVWRTMSANERVSLV